MDTELSALSALVAAADGHATPEPVIALSIAVASPWAGDRRYILDQPSKLAPSSPDALLRFLEKVRPQLAAPLPSDRDWLGWLRYQGLATPLSELEKVPSWVFDPALADGWLALPPHGPVNDLSTILTSDGRLALLHVLCSQIGADVPLDAVMTITEWFVGPKAAEWTRAGAEQCAPLRLSTMKNRQWYSTVRSVKPALVLPVVCGSPVAASWTRPAPSAAELQARREAELRRESVRLNFEAAHKPRKSA